MSAPARLRDMYVVGKYGSYLAATVAQCDARLSELRSVLRAALAQRAPKATVRRIRADQDRLLDRRTKLAFEEATAEAIRLTREP